MSRRTPLSRGGGGRITRCRGKAVMVIDEDDEGVVGGMLPEHSANAITSFYNDFMSTRSATNTSSAFDTSVSSASNITLDSVLENNDSSEADSTKSFARFVKRKLRKVSKLDMWKVRLQLKQIELMHANALDVPLSGMRLRYNPNLDPKTSYIAHPDDTVKIRTSYSKRLWHWHVDNYDDEAEYKKNRSKIALCHIYSKAGRLIRPNFRPRRRTKQSTFLASKDLSGIEEISEFDSDDNSDDDKPTPREPPPRRLSKVMESMGEEWTQQIERSFRLSKMHEAGVLEVVSDNAAKPPSSTTKPNAPPVTSRETLNNIIINNLQSENKSRKPGGGLRPNFQFDSSRMLSVASPMDAVSQSSHADLITEAAPSVHDTLFSMRSECNLLEEDEDDDEHDKLVGRDISIVESGSGRFMVESELELLEGNDDGLFEHAQSAVAPNQPHSILKKEKAVEDDDKCPSLSSASTPGAGSASFGSITSHLDDDDNEEPSPLSSVAQIRASQIEEHKVQEEDDVPVSCEEEVPASHPPSITSVIVVKVIKYNIPLDHPKNIIDNDDENYDEIQKLYRVPLQGDVNNNAAATTTTINGKKEKSESEQFVKMFHGKEMVLLQKDIQTLKSTLINPTKSTTTMNGVES